MTFSRYLIDTSALFRLLHEDGLTRAWQEHLTAGLVAVCPVVEVEFLFSARSLADRLRKQHLLGQVFTWVPMADRSFERAAEVQQLLTERGEHRSAGAVDLLIAATAEAHQLTVLADDTDFLTVGRVTGQRVRLIRDP